MEPALPPDPTTRAFHAQIAVAARRYRLERLAAVSLVLGWIVAAGLLLLLIAGLLFSSAWFLPYVAAGFVLACLLGAVVFYASRLDSHRLRVRMDTHARLPDSVLTTGDWERASRDPWREQQRRQTLLALENVTWSQAWPVRWPQLLRVPVACAALLVVGLVLVSLHSSALERANVAAAKRANAPVPKERLKPLEAVFADWEEAQKIAPSPEMEKLLKDIQPLRDQLAAGTLSQKQLFLKLNDVQSRLQAEQEKLEASSLADLAQPMAQAMQNLDAMNELSAALQRQDFAGARDQAAQAGQKYNSGAAKMPEGDNANAAASQLGEIGDKAAAKNPDAASALHQMQNSLSKKDGAGMGKGLAGLSLALNRESKSKSLSHCLGLQLSQLSQCKDGMCKNPGIKSGLTQISLAKSMQPQHGAGTATDPNHTGAATQLDASRQQVAISGTAGDGESETHTESTAQPQFEQTASGLTAAQFSQYEKMSDQAAEDENLPVGHRQLIKRYFESIHPQEAR